MRPNQKVGAFAVVALLAGCAHSPAPASRLPAPARSGPPALNLPERIVLPSAYRLVLLDGALTLVRETGPEAFAPGPSTLRIVEGEAERGELAYQPALLPQELAAELASARESSQRMDNALSTVMERSRELSEQTVALQKQCDVLASLLAQSRTPAPAPKEEDRDRQAPSEPANH